MKSEFENTKTGGADETLRLVAGLPAPEGLEERVHAALRRAPRAGRVLAWPTPSVAGREWLRGAAAAAIAFVICGGGWGVYSRVGPRLDSGIGLRQPAQGSPLIPHAAPGSFAGANAVRTPETLNGPVVAGPATVHPAQAVAPQGAQKTGTKRTSSGATAKGKATAASAGQDTQPSGK
jgi:hypothetical protein